jgi:hypothetical protein
MHAQMQLWIPGWQGNLCDARDGQVLDRMVLEKFFDGISMQTT